MTDDVKQQAAGLASRIDRLGERLGALRKAVPAAERLKGGVRQALLSSAAAVMAYLPTQALGLKEGFWGAITAIAVVQSGLGDTRNTGRDQFVGATIGGTIGVAVVLTIGQSLAAYILAVAASVMVSWAVNVASASRLSGITATIILLVPHTGTPEHMLLSRVGEVGWGALVGLGLVWGLAWLTERRVAG